MANFRWIFPVLALGMLSACEEVVSPDADSQLGIRRFNDPQPDTLKGPTDASAYIVVFKPQVPDASGLTDQLIREHGGTVRFRYGTALKGFAGALSPAALEGIRRNPNVDFVEPDGSVSVTSLSNPPSWGLDRLDQRLLPLDAQYSAANDGAGVRVYILDTGVQLSHPEYWGRAVSGWDFIDGDADASDCHGHGTHVAGTVGGATVGVARAASVVSVRVLNCSGSGLWSQVIAGVDWVAANHVKPAVANMSLGGGWSGSLNQAITNAVATGVTFAVAAGNENMDACTRSPASAAAALTVGATTDTDARATYSNYGGCLDLFAPGTSILSSVMGGGYASWSGTSMATPHVAGVAALYLAANPEAGPDAVANAILSGATIDLIGGAGTSSPNRLLYSQVAGGGTLPPPLPPPPPPGSSSVIHVGDLDGTGSPVKSNWSATVSILVVDDAGIPVTDALISGTWTNGASGNASCSTDAEGRCSVGKNSLKKNTAAVRFSVTNVTRTGASYAFTRNSDADGDSDGTSITVRRP